VFHIPGELRSGLVGETNHLRHIYLRMVSIQIVTGVYTNTQPPCYNHHIQIIEYESLISMGMLFGAIIDVDC
jgi:hypothetical protein